MYTTGIVPVQCSHVMNLFFGMLVSALVLFLPTEIMSYGF